VDTKENIILIGMPGAGKSTVGVVLAKALGRHFIDSDLVIQARYGKLLQELIDEYGTEGFREIENKVNSSLEAQNTVIATGGSAVYGRAAMEYLGGIGIIVYLYLPCEEVILRLGDPAARGVTIKKGQTLEELYAERAPLYEKYADLIIDCHNKSIQDTVLAIARKLP